MDPDGGSSKVESLWSLDIRKTSEARSEKVNNGECMRNWICADRLTAIGAWDMQAMDAMENWKKQILYSFM